MKVKVLSALILAILLTLVFSSVALGVSQATIDAIIKDAQDGTLDGKWTAAEVEAAIAYIEDNPTYQQYTDLLGVLEDYLASLNEPAAQTTGGELKFTGGELLMLFGAGAGLMGSGLALRRRRR
jgi:hypothetical protein